MYNSTHSHRPHGAETQNSYAYSNGGHDINESERNVSSIGNASERRPSNISVLSLVDKVHMARDEVFSGPMSESVPSSLTSYAHHARRADSIASFTFYRDDEPFLLLADGNVLDDSDSDIPVPRDDTIDLESGEIPPLGMSSETPEHDFLLSRASGRTNISYQGCESRVRQKIHIISDDITIMVVGFQNSTLGYIMYVALCCLSLGIGYLILHWMPSWKVSLIGKPCPLCECDWVVIENPWGELHVEKIASEAYGYSISTVFGKSEKYQIEHLEDEDPIMDELRILDYKYIRFLFHPLQDKFVLSNNWKDNRWKDLSSVRLGIDGDEKDARELIFSKNMIEIKQKPIFHLLIDEVLHPFYVFQIASLMLWSIDKYYYYAGCIFVISLVSIVATLFETLSTLQKLRNISRFECDVRVLRNSFWRYIKSSELVPGDVYEITDPALKQFPCDSILLAGDCIVNESMLTGESVPVSKSPTTEEALQNLNLGTASIPPEIATHVLFGGTKIIRARRPHEDRHGEAVAIAMVLRTGFNTTKGALVRSMLFPKPSGFKFYRDSFRYIYVMAGIALLGFIASFINFLHLNLEWHFIVIRALDLITIVIPPALPATLTIGMNFALSRLSVKNIFCISPQRVNVGGKLDIVCFDKTGTLTEDGLDVLGIRIVSRPENRFADLFNNTVSLYVGGSSARESNIENDPHKTALHAMATCHSLRVVESEIIGDPLDVKMFEFTQWTFEEGGQGNGYTGDEQGSLSPSVARPPLQKEDNLTYNGQPSSEHPIEIGILKSFEFSSQLRRTSVITRKFGTLGCDIYVKGAPECMKDICNLASFPLDYEDVLAYYTHRGFRVIALASKHIPKLSWVKIQKMQRNEAESELDFVGFIIFENKLKPNTEMVLNELAQAGIRKLMCTGDNILTAISVARECNLINPKEDCYVPHFIEGDFQDPNAHLIWENIDDSSLTLDEALMPITLYTDQDDPHFKNFRGLQEFSLAITGDVFRWIVDFAPKNILHKMLVHGQVFARMSPDEKNELVQKLQSIDYCCGFCGDGANDCGALKAADVGISLSDAEASVAAPFTSRVFDITCVPEIIREGRAALVTSFSCFKYMSLYSAIQFTSVSFLYASASNLGDFQFLFIDLALILPIAIFMGWIKPYPTLDRKRPTANLVSRKVLTPLLGQICLSVLFQTIGLLAVRKQDWYIPPHLDYGKANISNSQNTVLFLVSCFEYILSGIVLSVGPPFRQPWTRNYPFVLTVIVTLFLTTYMLLNPSLIVKNIMQLTNMNWDFKIFILVLGLSYFAISWLSENFLFNRVAIFLGRTRVFRKLKEQKTYKVVANQMYNY